MNAGAQIKGTSIDSMFAFLREEGLLARVMEALPAKSREMFSRRIMPARWYPVAAVLDLLDQIAAVHPDGDVVFRLGGRVIDDGLKGIYRIFLKVGSPLWVLEHSPGLWQTYFQGSDMVVVKAEANAGVIRVTDSGRVSQLFCWCRMGGISKALELASAKNVQITHNTCQADGAEACLFEFTWD